MKRGRFLRKIFKGQQGQQVHESRSFRAIFICLSFFFLVAVCAAYDSPAWAGDKSNKEPKPVQKTIGPAGGSVSVPGLIAVTVPRDSVPTGSKVTVSATCDSHVFELFERSSAFPDEWHRLTHAFLISLDASGPHFNGVTAVVTMPKDFLGQMPAGTSPRAFALNHYDDSEDSGEVSDDFIPVQSRLDRTQGSLSFAVPASFFVPAGKNASSKEATIVIAWRAGVDISEAEEDMGVFLTRPEAAPLAACSSLPPAGLGKPLPQGTDLVVTGLFGEPGHSGGAHTGVDFRATSLPVRAVATGTIARYGVEKSGNCYLVLSHGGWESKYNHLTEDSVATVFGPDFYLDRNKWEKVKRNQVHVPPVSFQVQQGAQIAISGKSGTTANHLDLKAQMGSGEYCEPVSRIARYLEVEIDPSEVDSEMNVDEELLYNSRAIDEDDKEIKMKDSNWNQELPITATLQGKSYNILNMEWIIDSLDWPVPAEVSPQEWITIGGDFTSDLGKRKIKGLSAGEGTLEIEDAPKLLFTYEPASFTVKDDGCGRFVDNGDGTITDISTGLIWSKQTDATSVNWYEAGAVCSGLGGRMPELGELEGLIDLNYFPTICPIFQCEPDWYWSATTTEGIPECAWSSYFYGGYSDWGGKDYYDGDNVRCVRGGL